MAVRRPRTAIVIADLPAEGDRRVIRESLSLSAELPRHRLRPTRSRALRVLPGRCSVRLKPYPIVVPGSGVATYALEFV